MCHCNSILSLTSENSLVHYVCLFIWKFFVIVISQSLTMEISLWLSFFCQWSLQMLFQSHFMSLNVVIFVSDFRDNFLPLSVFLSMTFKNACHCVIFCPLFFATVIHFHLPLAMFCQCPFFCQWPLRTMCHFHVILWQAKTKRNPCGWAFYKNDRLFVLAYLSISQIDLTVSC